MKADPNLRLFKLPQVDTLRLNPLCFPRNSYYHLVKHYQDGGLKKALLKRETEVLRLIAKGKSNKHIARDLELSVATVKNHIHSIFCKLRVKCRAEAAARVRENPWLTRSA